MLNLQTRSRHPHPGTSARGERNTTAIGDHGRSPLAVLLSALLSAQACLASC